MNVLLEPLKISMWIGLNYSLYGWEISQGENVSIANWSPIHTFLLMSGINGKLMNTCFWLILKMLLKWQLNVLNSYDYESVFWTIILTTIATPFLNRMTDRCLWKSYIPLQLVKKHSWFFCVLFRTCWKMCTSQTTVVWTEWKLSKMFLSIQKCFRWRRGSYSLLILGSTFCLFSFRPASVLYWKCT